MDRILLHIGLRAFHVQQRSRLKTYSQIDKWFTFELHFALGWLAFAIFSKKMHAFTHRRIIYSFLIVLGLVWGFYFNTNEIVYLLIFILAGPSVITKFKWRPKESFYHKVNLVLEGLFFGPLLQALLMAVYGAYQLAAH